jgi:hypothetical protein
MAVARNLYLSFRLVLDNYTYIYARKAYTFTFAISNSDIFRLRDTPLLFRGDK